MKKIRGFRDIPPSEIRSWEKIEATLIHACNQFGVDQIKLPLLEFTALYKRSVGESSDIVGKEMYAFQDQNDDLIALRPEGTAGAVRSFIEQGLAGRHQAKWWYNGPMFRRERPQKGRYRQFYQFGVELLGYENISSDLELILLSHHVFKKLDLLANVTLKINFLPEAKDRIDYNSAFRNYLQQHFEQLDDDSKSRLETNVLRIWDTKDSQTQEILKNAPRIDQFLSPEQHAKVQELQTGLSACGVDFEWDTTLVRGLDYYEGIVFEWVSHDLGAQGTVCGGGRYDRLCEILGGKATPATGLSFGIDRLVLLMNHIHPSQEHSREAIIFTDPNDSSNAHQLRQHLLMRFPTLCIAMDHSGSSLKKQMSRAHKNHFTYCLFYMNNQWVIKNLQAGVQKQLSHEHNACTFSELFNNCEDIDESR